MPVAGGASKAQIADAMRSAGFPENQIAIGLAVAEAESGLNPRAHNGKAPDNSYGLFQINMIGNLGPARRKEFGIASNEALYDIQTNVKAAYRVWKSAGGSWRPWTTFTGGSYKKFMGRAPDPKDPNAANSPINPDGSIDPDKAQDAVNSAMGTALAGINPFDGLTKQIREFTEVFRRSSLTFLVALLALIMIILGVFILLRDPIRRTAVRAASKVVSAKTGGLVKL